MYTTRCPQRLLFRARPNHTTLLVYYALSDKRPDSTILRPTPMSPTHDVEKVSGVDGRRGVEFQEAQPTKAQYTIVVGSDRYRLSNNPVVYSNNVQDQCSNNRDEQSAIMGKVSTKRHVSALMLQVGALGTYIHTLHMYDQQS